MEHILEPALERIKEYDLDKTVHEQNKELTNMDFSQTKEENHLMYMEDRLELIENDPKTTEKAVRHHHHMR